MDDSKLTDDQKKTVVAWIQSKTPLIGKCAVCNDRRYTVADHIVQTPLFSRAGVFTVGGFTYPYVPIVCMNCGNTQFISAVIAGVVTNEAPPEPIVERPPAERDNEW
jgi:hypothetical protein